MSLTTRWVRKIGGTKRTPYLYRRRGGKLVPVRCMYCGKPISARKAPKLNRKVKVKTRHKKTGMVGYAHYHCRDYYGSRGVGDSYKNVKRRWRW